VENLTYILFVTFLTSKDMSMSSDKILYHGS